MSFEYRRDTLERVDQEEYIDDPFWNDHYPKLKRYCHFLARNQWDGDDIAQETYMKALKYRDSQHNLSSALLNKIAYHHWIDLLRKRKNESIGATTDLAQQFIKNNSDDLAHSVELLLKQLTPKQAVIFFLKEAFQYKGKEIAQILCTTEMAVKASLNRARNRLESKEKTIIEPFWNEEERYQLSELLYEALKTQDPSILIRSIPFIHSLTEVSKPAGGKWSRTPSSTLCMAA